MSRRYIIENNLRHVPPYYHEFTVRAKRRWLGKTIVQVFQTDFGDDEHAIVRDITNNNIHVISNCGRKDRLEIVSGWDSLKDHHIVDSDAIYRRKHVHELPVPSACIETVYQSHDLLVVNKPAGIPTHPTGGKYHYNCVTEILKHEHGLENVWPCHRLDRATSGILILATTKSAASNFSQILQNCRRQTCKEYLARVVGKFPHQKPVLVNCPVISVNARDGYIPGGKAIPHDSGTIFKRVHYCPVRHESIVSCIPITGRSHQIRIHLRNLQFPIVTDPIYHPTIDQSAILKSQIEKHIYQRIFHKYPHFQRATLLDDDRLSDSECIAKLKTAWFETMDSKSVINVYDTVGWHGDLYLKESIAQLSSLWESATPRSDGRQCLECQSSAYNTERALKLAAMYLHAHKFQYLEHLFTAPAPEWSQFL